MLTRRALLAGFASLPLAACAARLTQSPTRHLRVATFNIWHDKKWPARKPVLLGALRSADADAIALQEVLEDAGKNLPNQAATLAAELGGYSVHFVSTEPEGSPRRYGNAILTRLPVIEEASIRLEPLNDYRTALRVRVDARGRPIDLVVTHLAWKPDQGPIRARQLAHLMSWLPDDGVPLVVMGDFNAPLSDSGLAALTSGRFESALPQGKAATTLNGAEGHAPRVIDHIFAERRYFAVEGARLIGDRPVNGVHASDHFGVAASLAFR
jgi:endonuclease/exonuclease/phosphatase family metal-dependent hydrolase